MAFCVARRPCRAIVAPRPAKSRMTEAPLDRPLRALILAPRGRDAEVACSLIEQTGVACQVCADLASVVGFVDDDVAFCRSQKKRSEAPT